MIAKYRAFALAIAALAFVVSFWYFGDPLTGILAAMIALVVHLIVFAFVIQQAAEKGEELTNAATHRPRRHGVNFRGR